MGRKETPGERQGRQCTLLVIHLFIEIATKVLVRHSNATYVDLYWCI